MCHIGFLFTFTKRWREIIDLPKQCCQRWYGSYIERKKKTSSGTSPMSENLFWILWVKSELDANRIMVFCDGWMSFFSFFTTFCIGVRKISKFNQTRLGSACFEKFGAITVIYFEFLFHTCLQQMSPWKEHLKYNDCYLENIQTYNSKIAYILVFLFLDVWCLTLGEI